MIVVDASVLATALGDDGPDGDLARARLRGERLSAPELVDLEVASVLRRQVQAGQVDIRRAALAVADLAALPLRRAPHRPLLARCWELRDNLTVYDASYVALAEALDVTLLTGDGRLARAPGPRCRVEMLRSASLPAASPSFLSCRVQNVYHTGEVCQLAGRWCRWVLADGFAGEDAEGVPVLRAAEGVPILFGLVEAEDVQAVEQGLGLVPGVEGQVRVVGPRVTGAEQLAGEDPPGGERLADPRPHGRELLWRTEWQAEAGVDQVSARQVRLGERRADNPDPSGGCGRDAGPEQREPGWLSVDR